MKTRWTRRGRRICPRSTRGRPRQPVSLDYLRFVAEFARIQGKHEFVAEFVRIHGKRATGGRNSHEFRYRPVPLQTLSAAALQQVDKVPGAAVCAMARAVAAGAKTAQMQELSSILPGARKISI